MTNVSHLLGRIHQTDCLQFMAKIPDRSIDMILCDLPYGTTACKWDEIIPLDEMWEQYGRIIKDDSAIVLTAAQPFTSKLIMSNLNGFRYEWIWDKKKPSTFLNAKVEPLRKHESILVFSRGKFPKYYPIKTLGKMRNKTPNRKGQEREQVYRNLENKNISNINNEYYPKSILEISNAHQKGKVHPTQKPVELFEYLIKTYSLKGDVVLDNCMGSGTTAVACERLGRKWFGCELEPAYVTIANKRIEAERAQLF